MLLALFYSFDMLQSSFTVNTLYSKGAGHRNMEEINDRNKKVHFFIHISNDFEHHFQVSHAVFTIVLIMITALLNMMPLISSCYAHTDASSLTKDRCYQFASDCLIFIIAEFRTFTALSIIDRLLWVITLHLSYLLLIFYNIITLWGW